jgi:hypothetical protein
MTQADEPDSLLPSILIGPLVALARPFQLPPHPPVEFGSVALHPAPNRRVTDTQTVFRHQFFQISIAKREALVPLSDRAG